MGLRMLGFLLHILCVLPNSGYLVSEQMDGQSQSVTRRESVPQVIYGAGLAGEGDCRFRGRGGDHLQALWNGGWNGLVRV